MKIFVGWFLLVLFTQGANAGNLVDAAWLEKNRESAEVLLLDAQPPNLYAKQHIPGAINADVFKLASFGVRDMPLAEIERMFQAMGLTPGRKVVMYDQGGTWFATRLFFSLTYYGFPAKDLFILDGGIAKWQALGLPVTKDATPAPKPGTFRVTKTNEDVRARLPELVAASGDTRGKVLVDALGLDYHYGATGFFNKAGHIPHAVSLPSEDLFNADKTFKSPEEMKAMLSLLSIRPEQEIQAHCGGGGAASVPYFALKHIVGYPKVKLSLESQLGWLQDDRDLPFWTYAAPGMMRETDWLRAWGGKMLRMYGIARVSVVDVRPAAAYGQGHVPFALNVPAESFRGNIADPAKLAEILGASGVDPSHEAVIVSSAGVTKEAALAYVMLEKLGQQKVSIFMESMDSIDSLDRMSRRGFAVTKDVAPVRPVAYVAKAQADSRSAASSTIPKVFIASGAQVPAKPPEGQVVHVPYTELLKPDGTPKEAKDIWAVLTKAGVPRYATLVAFSDDPGEAAVNYYVLKLMGYPAVTAMVGT